MQQEKHWPFRPDIIGAFWQRELYFAKQLLTIKVQYGAVWEPWIDIIPFWTSVSSFTATRTRKYDPPTRSRLFWLFSAFPLFQLPTVSACGCKVQTLQVRHVVEAILGRCELSTNDVNAKVIQMGFPNLMSNEDGLESVEKRWKSYEGGTGKI